MKFLKKIKSKQLVVVALAVLIAAAAFVQFSYNPQGQSGQVAGEMTTTDSSDGTNSDTPVGEAVAVSEGTNEYFAQAKIDKESLKGQNVDALREIANDTNTEKDVKSMAQEEMVKIVSNSEKEGKIEALIKEKGFSDALVYIGEDGSADVIVKSPTLNEAQTAQIYDILVRQANISGEKLSVKNMY